MPSHAAQLRDLHAALNAVTVNAQAIAAADTCIGAVQALRDRFAVLSLRNERRHWGAALQEALDDVRRFRGPMEGMPAAPVSPASWDDLRHAIGRAYNRLWSIMEDPTSGDSEAAAFFGYIADVAAGTIDAMPRILAAALATVSGAVAGGVAPLAKGLLPFWPLVAGVAVVLVLAVVVLGVARKEGVPV